jgi:hypothetical protein
VSTCKKGRPKRLTWPGLESDAFTTVVVVLFSGGTPSWLLKYLKTGEIVLLIVPVSFSEWSFE